jgi:hypothetical protein
LAIAYAARGRREDHSAKAIPHELQRNPDLVSHLLDEGAEFELLGGEILRQRRGV